MTINEATKQYNILIERAKKENRRKLNKNHKDYVYYENHHILPKSIHPEYEKSNWNQVLLTAPEHFKTHFYLLFMYNDKLNNYKMNCAFVRFVQGIDYNTKNKLNSEEIDIISNLLEEYSQEYLIAKQKRNEGFSKLFSGKNHPCYGKKQTEEHINKRKETINKRFPNGRKWSDEQKEQRCGEGNPMFGKKKNEESIKKQKESYKARSEKDRQKTREKHRKTWNNKSDKEKEQIRKNHSDAWHNKTEEEKKAISEKLIEIHKNRTDEKKEQMIKNRKKTWNNKSKEENEQIGKKHSDAWYNKTEEEKKIISKKRSDAWHNKTEEEKKEISKKLSKAGKGRKHTKETIENMKKAQSNRPLKYTKEQIEDSLNNSTNFNEAARYLIKNYEFDAVSHCTVKKYAIKYNLLNEDGIHPNKKIK
jgi:hypothetical protein